MSPLTRYNSEVGFSVTLGLILGMGRQIEKNVFAWNESQQNNIYLEILRANSPSTWLDSISLLYNMSEDSINLPSVRLTDHFGSMRRMIEVLNHDYNRYCENGLPKQ